MHGKVRLHINVDHVATLRQARGTPYPDPVDAALMCEMAGADGITVHLREDRRHIQDRDVEALRKQVTTLLNLEMAATDEMVAIATRIKPNKVTLVPERREERTTEGGLDVVGHRARIADVVRRLGEAGVPVSLFIAPDADQVRASIEVGASEIELHTGDYADAFARTLTAPLMGDIGPSMQELERLRTAAEVASIEAPALGIAAGHGLTVQNVPPLILQVPAVCELNIGHAVVADALFHGLTGAVRRFREAIRVGRQLDEVGP